MSGGSCFRSVRAPALLAAAVALALALAGACAKTPTVVVTDISADASAPPVLQLRVTVRSTSDPALVTVNAFSSLFHGDAADRPAPYPFPLRLAMNVPRELAGEVDVTVDGLDWVQQTLVIASGTMRTEIVAEHQTLTAVTLSAVAGGGGVPDGGGAIDEAGTDDAGGDDAGAGDGAAAD